MACFHPLLAADLGVDSSTGKHKIKILPRRADFNLECARSLYGESLMMLPCGHCVGCAKDYARMWQARILCEASYFDKKCFLTLTYAEEREPNKDDLRAFIKALRNRYGNGIKFFACGELGSKTKRFHSHMILFGVDFSEDRKVISKRGLNFIYTSKTLDDLWKHGYASFGDVDVASAGYVSKYCDKKKISCQDDGEFVIMSRGLGKRYFEDHKQELFESDYVYFSGNKFKIPRYFLVLARRDDFNIRIYADDLAARKRNVAQNFRYDKCRSFIYEEEGMIENAKIELFRKVNSEGERDVY